MATTTSSGPIDLDGLTKNKETILQQPLEIIQDRQLQESGDATLYGQDKTVGDLPGKDDTATRTTDSSNMRTARIRIDQDDRINGME